MEQLKSTPLTSHHRALGALMAPFGGWDMPIQYEGIIAEHRACRDQAALFDICHMGEFIFSGDIVKDGLEDVFTFSVASIPVGRSKYGFLLNEAGGIIDDLIVFRLAEDKAMIVVNAATADNDFEVIGSRLKGGGLANVTGVTGKLDLQGPHSRVVMERLFGAAGSNLPYFKFTTAKILGFEAIVSRTGYTGELGYEIFIPNEKIVELWELILSDDRVKPAGLGSRDLLRLEVGYSLYGSDLSETITPLEAGLESFVNFDKEFIGKGALLSQKQSGLTRVKVPFKVGSRRSPRHDYTIMSAGENVGIVTSGAFSPMLGCGIGIGFVPPNLATPGTPLTICHDKVSMEAEVCNLPFFKGGSLRS
ncbi:MAG: glycine cleavage system aminomethyltransferase GcvT [Geobacteraceae bacterium]|nr:glycine cleavage system aminomethyltransferase GcvT [Geobacteraceae bacterium]